MKDLILISLVCWRITSILVDEDGPYKIFVKLRDLVKDKKWSPLKCFYCTSVWVAVPLSLFFGGSVIYIFAISAGSILFSKLLEK